MESLANKLTKILVGWSQNKCNSDDFEVYNYGLQCFLNSLATIIILFLWGLLSKTLPETICWLAVFCLYRHYAGGVHASTSELCVLLTSLLGISNYVVLSISNIVKSYQLPLFAVIIIICILIVPVKSSKKELSRVEKKKNKIKSLLTITICFLLTNPLPISYGTSIIYALITASILVVLSIF